MARVVRQENRVGRDNVRATCKKRALAPALLTSLTGEQAAFLREATEKRGGVYVPINRGTVALASSLVEGGAATFREVSQTGGGRSASDPRPCVWTDIYLVPTQHGRRLLEAERK